MSGKPHDPMFKTPIQTTRAMDIQTLIDHARAAKTNPPAGNNPPSQRPPPTHRHTANPSHYSPTSNPATHHPTRRKKGFLQVVYNNIRRSDSYTHTILETYKRADIILIAEPNIFRPTDSEPGAATHPAFHRHTNNLNRDTKLLVSVNKQLGSHISIYQDHFHAEITTGATTIIGLYANPQLQADQLRNLLNPLHHKPGPITLGDFNAHHSSWGHKTNRKGEMVYDWALERDPIQQVPPKTTTWRKGGKESTLGLIFTSKGTQFLRSPDHLQFLASDHCVLIGEVNVQREESHTYAVTDWAFFERYREDPTPYQPDAFRQS